MRIYALNIIYIYLKYIYIFCICIYAGNGGDLGREDSITKWLI